MKHKFSQTSVPTLFSLTGSVVSENENARPGTMGGEFILPDTGDAEVTLNSKKVIPVFPSVRLEPGVNQIELTVNSF